MKTLLQPGDKIRIRNDIQQGTKYKMRTSDIDDLYLITMANPDELVTIKAIVHGTYRIEEQIMYNYTDDMFEPDVIELLYQDYLKNK